MNILKNCKDFHETASFGLCIETETQKLIHNLESSFGNMTRVHYFAGLINIKNLLIATISENSPYPLINSSSVESKIGHVIIWTLGMGDAGYCGKKAHSMQTNPIMSILKDLKTNQSQLHILADFPCTNSG